MRHLTVRAVLGPALLGPALLGLALLGLGAAEPAQAASPVMAAAPAAGAAAPVRLAAAHAPALVAAHAPALVAAPPVAAPQEPRPPATPRTPSGGDVTVSVPGEPSGVVQIILLITVLGAAPAILLLCTAFTKIVVVLGLTRSALGTPTVPPNQVLAGLALFLALFVMGPTLDAMNREGLTPYLAGDKTSTQAYRDGVVPLREFMLEQTRDEDLALMTKAAGAKLPAGRDQVDLRTLVPAFVISELRAAFIIGFVVFVPFLVIDLVVSAILMSLGMVMLPPTLVSLPFKILLFVLVDGWTLVVTTLVGSYR